LALDRVAELSNQAAADAGVLSALRDNPATIQARLNLSDAHLRALISAGSFTSARPAATTSRAEESLSNDVAAIEVATLFPPEGQGQFASGELPPVAPVSSTAPAQVPASAPRQGPAVAPSGGGAAPTAAPHSKPPQPHSASPQAKGAPQGVTPRSTPSFVPSFSGGPGSTTAPGTTTGTPGSGTSGTGNGTPGVTTGATGVSSNTSSGGGSEAGLVQQGPTATWTPTTWAVQAAPASSDCGCCGSSEVAITSIVAEVTTTAETAIAAITAIAGLH
jgi:hypothetical protein